LVAKLKKDHDMWTDITRQDYAREGKRHATDLSDTEWAEIADFLPKERPGGRHRKTDLREVVNALFYLASSGCSWRLLPKDFPPITTVRHYFYRW